jgi:hypothetical protein
MTTVDSLLIPDKIFSRTPVESSDFRPFVVLLTRFAMAVKFSEASWQGSAGDMRGWLHTRMPLFERYCLPAVRDQTRKPDLWLLGARHDVADDIGALDFVDGERVCVAPQRANPAEVSGHRRFESSTKAFVDAIRRKLPDDFTHLLTVRLDSDDVIHHEYLNAVVCYCSHLVAKEAEIKDALFSVPFGLQREGERFSAVLYPNGPFQARLESLPSLTMRTAYRGNHLRFYDHDRAFVINTVAPFWMQVIHESNVSNAIRPGSLQFDGANNASEIFGSLASGCGKLLRQSPAKASFE